MASIKEQDRWSAGATDRRRGSHGNETMASTAYVEIMTMTPSYLGAVVNGVTEDGLSVVEEGSTWWPDETPWFRTLLVILYGSVFVGCVVGNLLVILAILCHRRTRSDVNFFLSNLALADLCVGVFCVLPNLLLYISQQRWLIGRVMCKLFYFFQSLNYSCSVIILTVISLERYLAIKYPMLSRRRVTRTLLVRRVVASVVWITSVVYSLPLLLGYDIHYDNYVKNSVKYDNYVNQSVSDMDIGGSEMISDPYCYNSNTSMKQIYVMVDFVLLYIIPLSLMTFMYAKISVVLWRTGNPRELHHPCARGVNEAIACRALSEDACRTRLVRADSLRNPSSLHVQLKAPGSSSTSGSSSGTRPNVTPCVGYNECGDLRFRSRSSSTLHNPSTLAVPRMHVQTRYNSVGSVPSRIQLDEVRPLQSTSLTSYPVMIRHEVPSIAAETSECPMAMDHVVTKHARCDGDGLRLAGLAILFDKLNDMNFGRPHDRRKNGRCPQSSTSSHRNSPIGQQHHQPQQQQQLFHNEVDGLRENVTEGGTRPFACTSAEVECSRQNKKSIHSSSVSSTLQRNALLGRRRIIRLLIMFVVSFALCMLPHHARLQWQRWAPDADTHSELVYIVPPITTLMFYINSCLNPFLYALVSDKFRKAVSDIRFRRQRSPREIQLPLIGMARQAAIKSRTVNGFSPCRI